MSAPKKMSSLELQKGKNQQRIEFGMKPPIRDDTSYEEGPKIKHGKQRLYIIPLC